MNPLRPRIHLRLLLPYILVLFVAFCFLLLTPYYLITPRPTIPSTIPAPNSPIDLRQLRANPSTNVYELDGKPILWQYWHDREKMPLYVRLFVEAMQCRNPEFRSILVHDSSVREILPDFPVSVEMFDSLIPPHRSDIFRIQAMLKYGGAYADVDTFAADRLITWYRKLSNGFDFVTADWMKTEISAFGAFGPARAGLSIFRIWSEYQMRVLRSSGSDSSSADSKFGWSDFGRADMPEMWTEIEEGRVRYLGFSGVMTVGRLVATGLQDNATALFRRIEDRIVPLAQTPFVFMHHDVMRRQLRRITDIRRLFPNEPTLYSAFIGCALADCWHKYELMSANGQRYENDWLDVDGVLRVLRELDREVCDKLQQRLRPEEYEEMERYYEKMEEDYNSYNSYQNVSTK